MTDQVCHEYQVLLARAADGSLDQAAHAHLAAHLESCEACRDALAAQEAVRAALVARPIAGASAAFEARVLDAIAGDRSPAPFFEAWDWRKLTWRVMPIAAALLIVALGVARATPRGNTAPTGAQGVSSSSSSTETESAASTLWSGSVSGAAVLSLMIYAHADDTIAANSPKDK